MKYLFGLTIIGLSLLCSSRQAQAEVSDADNQYAQDKCGIKQADLDIIPSLKEDVRNKLLAAISGISDTQNCKPLTAFKVSRIHYRKNLKNLRPGDPVPINHPYGWSSKYLSPDEFAHLQALLSARKQP